MQKNVLNNIDSKFVFQQFRTKQDKLHGSVQT